jgi:hypothetical protein
MIITQVLKGHNLHSIQIHLMEDKLYPKGYSVFFFMNNMDIHRYIDF